MPRFRKKVMWVPFGQGRPVWIDDPDFDIADHVKVMVLPGPGTREQLFELCELLQMRLLDRDRPLWELWFVGGLDDGNVAMIEKVHHALVDGVSGVDAAAATLDLDRDAPLVEAPPWTPAPAPTPGRLLAESLWGGPPTRSRWPARPRRCCGCRPGWPAKPPRSPAPSPTWSRRGPSCRRRRSPSGWVGDAACSRSART
ncbi:MAG: wax ester/triacylglycerol synthase family O-acyltransferase [Acidimicrobiales bacterium]